ncbi:MAG: hypothetical protein LBM03_01100 [Erysipelotrichaceae bacterium]|nr:hypothetical protein [Erysipelotrichaceae bacterium]
MNLFKKNETILQNISFMSIMAGINALFALLMFYLSIVSFVLIFILPLTSVLVTIYCKKRYYVIYLFTTIALCLLMTWGNFIDLFFYIIPSLVAGFFFALLVIKKMPSIFIILSTSIIEVSFTYLAIPLINLIYQMNMIEQFLSMFGLLNNETATLLVPTFILILSLIQSTISYMVINDELPKFKIVLLENKNSQIFILVALIISSVTSIILSFLTASWSIFFLMISLYFGIYLSIDLLDYKKIWIYVSEGISLLITFFVFSSLYSFIKFPNGFISIITFPILVGLISFINIYLSKYSKKDTINKGSNNG